MRDPGTLFFRNRHLLWLAIAVILVGGITSATSLPRLEDPRIVNRGPMVITAVPGASAERVESLVTDVLENALDEVDAIKHIESTSRSGISIVWVELKEEVDADASVEAFSRIRDKVSEAEPMLPPEAAEPFVDDQRDAVAYTLVVGVTWAPEAAGLSADAPPPPGMLDRLAEDLADDLRNIPGTELVRTFGSPEEEISVLADADELAAIGLSAADVSAAIGRADAKRPAGIVRAPSTDLLLEVSGELDSVRRIERIPLASQGDTAILTVGDVAEVRRAWRTPVDEIGLVDGRRSVLVAARLGTGVRIDRWAASTDAVLDAFARERGPGIVLDRVFSQEGYTSERLGMLLENLLAGAGVILVCIFVIMGARPAFVVGMALPLVVSLVLLGWSITGGAIHQMSVFGLIIALGLLIDNAIVVTDEVTSARAAGTPPLEAVRKAVHHLFLPLLASTMTTVLAFAPIMLLPGSAGDFVGSIGTSVIMAIIASFGVALTIIASLAGLLGRPAPGPDGTPVPKRWWRDGIAPAWLATGFRRVLARIYRVPLAAIAIAVALPLAGFAIAPNLGNQFFPPVDRNMFEVRVELSSDASIAATESEARAVEATLRALDGVESVDWLIGGSYPSVFYNLIMNRDGAASYAHAMVTTESPDATKRLIDEAQVALDAGHPRARILVRSFAQGPPVVADIEYRLIGPDTGAIQGAGDVLRRRLQAHPDVVHTEATMPRGEPKLFFDADEDAVRLAGLDLAGVADQLASGLEGATAGTVIEDLERLPVRVRLAAGRDGPDAVASIPLASAASDRWVQASSLGAFVLRPELGGITRYDGERTNTIKAYTRAGSLPIDIGNAVLAEARAAGEIDLPPGHRILAGGASEQDAEANANLAKFAPVLGTLMVATLILAFRSVRDAMVLGCVALGSVGLALLATWSIDFPVSFNTILGTLGLIGVALNDSIVVLASIRENRRASAGHIDAMVDAVMGCTRHVLATTATTIGGFLPLLLFAGGDFWPSLAIVLAGGIGGASLIALFFVPAACLLMPRRDPGTEPAADGDGAAVSQPGALIPA